MVSKRVEDLKPEDLKDGKFIDKDGVEQLAVPLSSIFNMVGGKRPPVAKPHPDPIGNKKPNRGIKIKK